MQEKKNDDIRTSSCTEDINNRNNLRRAASTKYS